MEQLEDFRKAGNIASEVRKYAASLVKHDVLYLELAEKVESEILRRGGKLAFPCNVSVNEVAAHHIPLDGEKLAFKDGDLVKVDFGVHINGAIADTAISVSVGKNEENSRLIKASEDALSAAINVLKPKVKISEIGAAINKEIVKFGFLPIRNLCGHSLGIFELHAGTSIPNYDSKSSVELEDNQIVALEPFATNGSGLVSEGSEISVYRLENRGAVRVGKEILDFIISEYKTLPFARRWLTKKFGQQLKVNLFLKEAIAKKIIYPYNVLLEGKGTKVAQAEHTVLIKEKPEILTE